MNEQFQIFLKEAFKEQMRQYLGSFHTKPIPELRAWNLAMVELASECEECQMNLEGNRRDKAVDNHSGQLPVEYDPSFPYPKIQLGPNAPQIPLR